MKIVVKEISENYNISREPLIKSWIKLISMFLLIIITLYVFLIIIWNILVNYISIETEKKWFWDSFLSEFKINNDLTKQLRGILWSDFKYDIYVANLWEENAYTLPWAKIIISESLYNNIEHKNSLLFIVWHEVAHLENRDVLKKIFSDFPIKILLIVLWINDDIGYSVNGITNIYSKNIEYSADKKAIDFVYNYSLDVWCSLDFFENNNSLLDNVSSFASSHPITKSRIDKIKTLIKEKWYNSNSCELLRD